MSKAAFADLDKAIRVDNVDLPSVHSVGMRRGSELPRLSWKDSRHDFGDHVGEVVAIEDRVADSSSPDVELMRFSDVISINDIAPVGNSRTTEDFFRCRIIGQIVQ